MKELIREIIKNPSIIIVIIGTFFFWASLYLYVPILPNHSKDLGASATMIGYIVASYAIGQIILRIPLGIAVDLWGIKLCNFTMLCSGIGSFGLLISDGPIDIFFARLITGVAGAGWVAVSLLFASQFKKIITLRKFFHDGYKWSCYYYFYFIEQETCRFIWR